MLRRSLTLLLFLAASLGVSQAADKPKSVWDGAYTAAQAERGQAAYSRSCMRCHGEDMTKSGDVLVGTKFMDHWREDSVKNLFTILKDSMPRNAPRSLSDAQYLDIVSYLLQVNSFPAGSEELTLEALDRIQIVGKDGAGPVPSFALVTVVGCLAQVSADTWTLKNASEPVRTHNPYASTDKELADVAAKVGGQHTFRLLDIRNFPAQPNAGHWMEAKGLLIRDPNDDRLNLTWLRSIRDSCAPPQ